MASSVTTKREANSIYRSISSGKNGVKDLTVSSKHAASTQRPLDKAIDDIYLQAHVHRNRLVTFYIIYTVSFSLFVALLITLQAFARTVPGKETIELIPQWALNLLVAGMFGQFISLLTIVTKKVWTFEPFLQHHLSYKTNKDGSKDQES